MLRGMTTDRWLLAGLLILQLLIIAFWFGALWPLLLASSQEAPATNAAVVEQFSRVAIRLVPVVFLAGFALAVALLPSIASLSTPYGLLLQAKVAAFALLMILAALNKWRLAPRIRGGDPAATRALRRSIMAEWVLIAGVIAITAAMTGLFSPSPH